MFCCGEYDVEHVVDICPMNNAVDEMCVSKMYFWLRQTDVGCQVPNVELVDSVKRQVASSLLSQLCCRCGRGDGS